MFQRIDIFNDKWHFLVASLFFWIFIGCLEVMRNYYFSINWGEEFNWAYRLSWSAGYQTSLWLGSFFIYLFYHSTKDLETKAFLIKHFMFMLVISVFILVLTSSIATAVRLEAGLADASQGYFLATAEYIKQVYPIIFGGIAEYGFVLSILLALNFYHKYRDQTVHSAQLESKLAQSQLQTLKMQLHPHFLFNAMNTISMLIRRGKDEHAIEMISGLSDMLRSTLTKENKQLVTFEEELDLAKKYLAIEQVRFKDKLRLEFDVEEEALEAKVPNLFLQPILENAFKHGISKSLDKAKLTIKVNRHSNRLLVSVFNSGPSINHQDTKLKKNGIGLRNTMSRFKQIFDQEFSFAINGAEGGTLVEISFPIVK